MSLRDSIKVTIVDDMAVSRGLLTQALEEIGVRHVDYEKSGNDAFAKLAANPSNLVISDYNMPGMSGLDLLEKLRFNRTTQRIGFILVTGSPSQDMVERGTKLGLNNIIRKPFTTASLKASIEAVVGRL